MSKNERIINSWEANAEAWIDSIQNNTIKSRVNVTNDAIVNTVTRLQPNRILDMGSGEGWLCRELSDRGIQTVGVDGSLTLVEEAKKLHSGEYHHITYEQFAENPNRFEHPFDAVVFNFSLLAKDIEPLLLAVQQVLSSNGHIVIQTLHPFSFGHPYVNHWKEENHEKLGEGYKKSMPWYFRTFSGWNAVLNEVNLQVVECHEPINSETLKPESLIFVCQKKES